MEAKNPWSWPAWLRLCHLGLEKPAHLGANKGHPSAEPRWKWLQQKGGSTSPWLVGHSWWCSSPPALVCPSKKRHGGNEENRRGLMRNRTCFRILAISSSSSLQAACVRSSIVPAALLLPQLLGARVSGREKNTNLFGSSSLQRISQLYNLQL